MKFRRPHMGNESKAVSICVLPTIANDPPWTASPPDDTPGLDPDSQFGGGFINFTAEKPLLKGLLASGAGAICYLAR